MEKRLRFFDKHDVIVVGIGGVSNGGKTTLAQRLIERYPSAIGIHQDNFYKEDVQVPWSAEKDTRLWDVVEALDVDKLIGEVHSALSQAVRSHNEPQGTPESVCFPTFLIIIEGTMVLSIGALEPFLSAAWFFTLDYDTMLARRKARYYKGPPDISSYFDDHVWTGYMRDLKMACSAHKDGSARMLNGTKPVSEHLEEVNLVICELLGKRPKW